MNKTLSTSIIAIALAGGGAIGLGSLAAASYGDAPPTLDDNEAADTVDAEPGDETPDDTEPVGLQDATNDTGDATTGDTAGDATGEPGEGRRGRRGHVDAEVAAEALGITTDELHSAREAGQSLAGLAAAQNVSVDTLVQALTDDAQAHIAEEVAAGELTQEEADERLAGLEARITERVNETPGEGGGREECGFGDSEAVADVLGLTADELSEARAAGQSLADVATAQGVSVDAVVDAIVGDIEERLTEEVAEGDLTQAEADERLAGAEERAAEQVDAVPGEGGQHGARGPGARRGQVATDG